MPVAHTFETCRNARAGEGHGMWEGLEEIVERRVHPKRHRRRLKRKKRELTPQERAYRAARARANRKLGFLAHFVPYCTVVLFIAFVAGLRPALIVATGWGIGVVCHYFFAIVAPDLRRRLIEREVQRELVRSAPQERAHLEDRHARSLEELSASIAHEIRNPITAAKSLVQQMGEDPSSSENVAFANVALEELDRVERSISHLLRFARDEELRLAELHVADVVASALDTLRDRCSELGIELKLDLDGESVMQGDAEKLRRVLINLVRNSVEALEGSDQSDPRIEIASGENLAGSDVWLRVRDNGPGIDPETLDKMWSPFFTSKESGTGLGLALSRKVVEAHGGVMEASSRLGEGTEFLLTFPKQFTAAPGDDRAES